MSNDPIYTAIGVGASIGIAAFFATVALEYKLLRPETPVRPRIIQQTHINPLGGTIEITRPNERVITFGSKSCFIQVAVPPKLEDITSALTASGTDEFKIAAGNTQECESNNRVVTSCLQSVNLPKIAPGESVVMASDRPDAKNAASRVLACIEESRAQVPSQPNFDLNMR